MIRKITIALIALTMLMAPFAGIAAADYSGDFEPVGETKITDEVVSVDNDTATLYVDLEFSDNASEYGELFVEVFDEDGEPVDDETVTPSDDGNESFDWDTEEFEEGDYSVVISTDDDDGGAIDSFEIGTLDGDGDVLFSAGGSSSGLWAESIPGGQTTLIVVGLVGLVYVYLKQDR